MASREDILPGDDEQPTNENEDWMTTAFKNLSIIFFVLAVGVGYSTGQRDPVIWLTSYSKFWVYFTLPYLAIRNSPVYR